MTNMKDENTKGGQGRSSRELERAARALVWLSGLAFLLALVLALRIGGVL
jgi:hypothetical protein